MKRKKNPKAKRDSRKIGSSAEREEYDYHLPVFLKEACDYLVTDSGGTYIDGTLGGGGHTAEVLSRLAPNGKLLSFDKDESAIAHCREKFWGELQNGSGSRLILYNECYSKACGIQEIGGNIDGILLDLGLSSRQLDESRRGFSYRKDTTLDMRFGPDGKTAEEILHAAKEEKITEILRNYGEEPFARRIARRIVQRRRALPFQTTFDLRSVVEESVPFRFRNKSLSRVFQAFRIAVNHELDILQSALNDCLPIMSSGARIVVISYHSLEDRIVKNYFKDHSLKKSKYKTDIEATKNMPLLKIITPKPITPGDDEIARNPRARSAKMRVAEVAL
ncbi:16S rRNA (cytosine(1402)-N(4))-methyltransferase RsmH [Bacteroidota bacterium]